MKKLIIIRKGISESDLIANNNYHLTNDLNFRIAEIIIFPGEFYVDYLFVLLKVILKSQNRSTRTNYELK